MNLTVSSGTSNFLLFTRNVLDTIMRSELEVSLICFCTIIVLTDSRPGSCTLDQPSYCCLNKA